MREGKNGKKAYVAISGGVDSSVAAALLKERGFEVTGVFMKVWTPDFLTCDWKTERRDAMRVTAKLDIPFKTFDFEEEYKKEVADYMIAEYAAGRTPNPDVMCNKEIKFGAFLEKALEEGADCIATGHYAQVREDDGTFSLYAGVDAEKDQSYFLWALTQEQLQRTLFPVGEMTKNEVRAKAAELGLPTAEKKDSQGICFLGEVDVREFLSHYIPKKKGDVLDTTGNIIGTHEGAHFYTIGQRHGFTVTKKSPDSAPLYIVGKNLENNTITVSGEKEKELYESGDITIEKTNWISGPPKEGGYAARIRYRQPLSPCVVKTGGGGRAMVVFEEPQRAVAAGQSLVIYDGDRCLGGGIIA